MNNKKIFTFWEPKGDMPAYLKLCMQTWKKFLHDFEIITLDYSSVDDWLGKNFFDETLYTDYNLSKQADAIRCALLEKYGGIWFDCDVIITSSDFKRFLDINSECIMFSSHIGVIIARKHSKVMQYWLNGIKNNLLLHKICKNETVKEKLRAREELFVERINSWDYMGNSILDRILPILDKEDFYSLDKYKYNFIPEENYLIEQNMPLTPDIRRKTYSNFYFKDNQADYVINKDASIIYLHNSWTPEKYKLMSEDEFLSENNTLSNLFKRLL